jgi:hypothetical protein
MNEYEDEDDLPKTILCRYCGKEVRVPPAAGQSGALASLATAVWVIAGIEMARLVQAILR